MVKKSSRAQNLFWGSFFCLLGTIFAFYFLQAAWESTMRAYWYRRLVPEEEIIEGHVVKNKRWRPDSTKNLVKCFIDYSYTYNGQEYIEKEFPIPTELCSSLQNGQTLSLFISKESPEHSIPMFYTPDYITTICCATLGGIAAIATLFVWYLLYLYARRRMNSEILGQKLNQWNRKIF